MIHIDGPIASSLRLELWQLLTDGVRNERNQSYASLISQNHRLRNLVCEGVWVRIYEVHIKLYPSHDEAEKEGL